ncbi:MAG: S-layer protein [Firmicutes bacterium]|nr:S-layer protein [Bacillota bacterium]
MKKTVISITAGCLTASILFSPAIALANSETKLAAKPIAVEKVKEGQVPQATISLNDAIVKAKSLFNIGDEYDRFESNLNSYDGRVEWNLNWHKSQEPRGSITVRINAITGKVLNMNRWKQDPPGQEEFIGLPKFSYQEATKFAKEWGGKLAPDYFPQTRLNPENERSFSIVRRGPAEYSYKFERVANHITFPENNIYVRINANTGELVGYKNNWDEKQQFPAARNKISKQQAEDIFSKEVELVYFRPHRYNEDDVPVELVYRVKNGSSLYIDALTGEIIENARYYYKEMDSARGMGSTDKQELSPAEQEEVDEIENIISSKKALEYAKEIVDIPKDYQLNETRLSKNYLYPKQRQWNFRWSGKNGSCQAVVDAINGELVAFNNWNTELERQYKYGELSKENVKVTKEEAEKIAANFIKKLQNKRFSEIKLEQSYVDEINIKDEVLPRRYNFNYVRMVSDIPFPDNGFEVRVDPFTGNITNYRMNWWQLDFPKPSGLIDQDKAADNFINEGQFSLNYLRLHFREDQPEIHLAYHLQNLGSYMMDAKTGKLIDRQGKPIPPKPTKQFSDIKGHPAKEDIYLLAQANIIKSSDNKFYPNSNITKLEALAWLIAARGWHVELPYDDNKKRIVDAALELGIINNNTTDLDQDITKLELARYLINTLDYDGAAKLNNVYKLNLRDASEIPSQWKGYAALSIGLNLQQPIEGKFSPNSKITKGNAASAVVSLLKVDK